jgi:hypothetical protein
MKFLNYKQIKSIFISLLISNSFALSMSANADVIDNVRFKVLPLAVVWSAPSVGGTGPFLHDFVVDFTAGAGGGTDLMAGDGFAVVTGGLIGVPALSATEGSIFFADDGSGSAVSTFTDTATLGFLNAADTYTSWTLDGDDDITLKDAQTHSFYIASNAAFDINAGAVKNGAGSLALGDVDYSLAVTVTGNDGLAFGSLAQDPSTGGTQPAVADLSVIGAGPTKVFDGGRRTAASAGKIAQHSVRFDATYNLDGYDLSDGTPDGDFTVTYTVVFP